jgi:hypothetical protein
LLSFSIQAQESKEALSKKAEQYAKAVKKQDFEKVLDLTHPKVLEQFGGKRKMLKAAEYDAVQTKQKGFKIKDVELSEPLVAMDTNGVRFCAVPIRVTMSGPYGKVFSEAGLLGISENEGKDWLFVSLAQIDMVVLLTLFPELPTTLEMPVKQIYTE